MTTCASLRVVGEPMSTAEEQQEPDLVFAALSAPVHRGILERQDGQDLLVSEVAAHFDFSLQAISLEELAREQPAKPRPTQRGRYRAMGRAGWKPKFSYDS